MEVIYEKHFFVCENRRAPGERVSCGNQGSEEILKLLKKKAALANLPFPFRIQRAGCMERCELGPAQVCYPEGKWFNLKTESDVDTIIEHYFKTDLPSAYEHLLIKA